MKSIIKLEGDIIGLDLGEQRTGVARINTFARIAEPLEIIATNEDDFMDSLVCVIDAHSAQALVVGLPRGLDGQETKQTYWAKELTRKIQGHVSVPVFSIDEAGTTKQARESNKNKEYVDSIAAGILLEDFLAEVLRGNIENVSI